MLELTFMLVKVKAFLFFIISTKSVVETSSSSLITNISFCPLAESNKVWIKSKRFKIDKKLLRKLSVDGSLDIIIVK